MRALQGLAEGALLHARLQQVLRLQALALAMLRRRLWRAARAVDRARARRAGTLLRRAGLGRRALLSCPHRQIIMSAQDWLLTGFVAFMQALSRSASGTLHQPVSIT